MTHYKHILLPVFLLLSIEAFAQRRVSADVEVKTVTGGNVTTVTKSVYCLNNGRLVAYFHSPFEYVMDTNILGECKIYFPSSNEVYVDSSGSITSKDELLSLLLSGRLEDLGVSLSGYRLKTTERLPDALLKKTYQSTNSDMPAQCEIVYKDFLPIYSATLTEDGHPLVKVYYSRYGNVGYTPFPHRSTEIIYNSPKDSTVIRTIYSNIVIDGDDSRFDFSVPEDAKPLDMTPDVSGRSVKSK